MKTLNANIQIVIDQPHASDAPSDAEFADVARRIAFAAVSHAICAGLPRPESLDVDALAAELLRLGVLPAVTIAFADDGTPLTVHTENGVVVHV